MRSLGCGFQYPYAATNVVQVSIIITREKVKLLRPQKPPATGPQAVCAACAAAQGALSSMARISARGQAVLGGTGRGAAQTAECQIQLAAEMLDSLAQPDDLGVAAPVARFQPCRFG